MRTEQTLQEITKPVFSFGQAEIEPSETISLVCNCCFLDVEEERSVVAVVQHD